MNGVGKPKFLRSSLSKGIYQPGRVITAHLVFQRNEAGLMAVGSFYKLHTIMIQKLYALLSIHIVGIFG